MTAREMFCVLQSQVTALSLLLTLWNSATPDPVLRVRVPGLRWPAGCLGHCTLTPYTSMPPGFSALCLLPALVSRPLNSRSLVHCLVRGSNILIHSGSTLLEINRNSTLPWMPNQPCRLSHLNGCLPHFHITWIILLTVTDMVLSIWKNNAFTWYATELPCRGHHLCKHTYVFCLEGARIVSAHLNWK